MAIQIGAKPDSGFDDPLGMLKDCHRRIEHFLDLLCLVAERAQQRTLTDEEMSAVRSALQYFHVGGQRHTADEEQSLFPLLREVLPAQEFADLDRLEQDHACAETLHASTDALYTKWIAQGALDTAQSQLLLQQMRQLKLLYTEHIQVEESLVFPHAAQALDANSLAHIGAEFKARRE